jgi:hypothetical protein
MDLFLYFFLTWVFISRFNKTLMLRRIFGPEMDEETRRWRKLHKEELRDLYSSPRIIRTIKSRSMKCSGYVARMGENKNVYSLLLGKPEIKRPLGRQRGR